MKFWDSSAIVPLILPELTSDALLDVYEDDRAMSAWWSSRVECASAVERRGRFQSNPPIGVRAEAHRRLGALAASWQEIQPLTEVRDRALTLLAKHDLRAGDALQLSAAIAAVNWNGAMDFVCLDDRLNDAARSEGFRIVRPR